MSINGIVPVDEFKCELTLYNRCKFIVDLFWTNFET